VWLKIEVIDPYVLRERILRVFKEKFNTNFSSIDFHAIKNYKSPDRNLLSKRRIISETKLK
jgi:hypothetical protein